MAMELGERIYTLRTARGLSQADLADALEVSRQSISKWETGASVPELDKLLKLSGLFGVTLDELVTGAVPEARPVPPAPEAQPTETQTRSHGQTVAGVILLCFGAVVFLLLTLLGGLLEGLVFASPFLVCGVICFVARRRAGLWCAWAVSILVDIYLSYGTGIRWQSILYTLQWKPEWNYVRLAMAWGMFADLLALIAATVLCYRRQPMEPTRRNVTLLTVGAVGLAALYLPIWGWVPYEVMWVLQWVRAAVLAAVLTGLVRLRAGKKR